LPGELLEGKPPEQFLGGGVGNEPKHSAPRQSFTRQLFFKALQQNLKGKSFVGTSENALRIQIWTALLAILLLKWLHHLSQAKWSLSNLPSLLRRNLFAYRDLRNWLADPFQTPPLLLLPESQQLTLLLT
jgi:hypothetical protein